MSRFKYQFRLNIAGLLLTIAGVGLFTGLALWQLHRADEKQALQEKIDARLAMPPLQYDAEKRTLDEYRFRRFRLQGRYLPQWTILLDNIIYQGHAGYNVITPFLPDDGSSAVLVNRGWVAAPRQRKDLPSVATPQGRVELLAQLDTAGFVPMVGASIDDIVEDRNRWLFLDIDYFKNWSGLTLPPYVMTIDADSSGAFKVKDRLFNANVGMHIGYAFQWAAFALIALGTFLALSFRRRKPGQQDVEEHNE
ncbi:MAG: SURF1 family protein [gamma proteobacterium symbiont of Bathyaustriella thionipta]|nr:SURF1 family protein [gamma proteobacterium symbiont of Bathyaustriella thionipta]